MGERRGVNYRMDLSERSNSEFNRHPWELSRTDCLIKEMKRNKRIKTILKDGGVM